MSADIVVAPAPSVSENAALPPPSKPEDMGRKPLDDFVCHQPALRFVNLRKLGRASRDVIAYQKAIMDYKPTDNFANIQLHARLDDDVRPFTPERPPSPSEAADQIPNLAIEQLPSIAVLTDGLEGPDDPVFQRMLRKHEVERQNMAYDFRREQAQVVTNFYDAQIRENMQKNDMIDRRPISGALRHISRRIAYPIDLGIQRFYKYTFRCEKLAKKVKKSLEKMSQNHENRADMLCQKQTQDIQAYGDIHRVDVGEMRVPKLPTPPAPDVSQ